MDRNERIQLEKLYINNMVQNLPVLRASKDITQAGLAEKIGVSRQTVVAIERGSRPLTWSLYLAIALIFTLDSKTENLMKTLDVFSRDFI